MKNKSTRHKETNTFKFQPFSERITNIDVDIFHKVHHEYESQSDQLECYFYQAIQKWDVLNLTEGYHKFNKEIKARNYVTLPQLLLNKDHVVEVLLKHLKQKDVLCLQPLLDIVVAVAQDLQKEFYPYYPRFLEILVNFLNTKDTDQLEWTFTCLAYMFKFLWRPMIKNINSIFNSLLPLLSDSRPDYINGFAAESFAFVARKVKDRDAFLGHLVKAVENKNDGISGCGKLLFEVLRGVENQFHSCADTFFPFLLESLQKYTVSQSVLFEILEEIVKNIALHIHPQKNGIVWDCFINNLDKLIMDFSKQRDSKISHNITLSLKLLGQMVEYKSGKLVQNPTSVIQILIKILGTEIIPEGVLLTATQISLSVLLSRNIRLPQEQVSQIIRKILSLNNKNLDLYFVDNISSCSSFLLIILPNFLRKVAENNLEKEHLHVLTKLLLKKSASCNSSITISQWKKYQIDFKEYNQKVVDQLMEMLNCTNIEDSYFCALVCIPHLILNEQQKSEFVEELCRHIEVFLKVKQVSRKVLFVVNLLLETVTHLKGDTTLKVLCNNIFDFLLKCSTADVRDLNLDGLSALRSLSLLISMFKNDSGIINMENLEKIHRICKENFNSPYHEVRLLTCHIYTFFENLPEFNLKHSEDPEVKTEKFKVFTLCYEVESIESLVQTYRDQLQRLEKLNVDKPQMIMCNQTQFRLVPLRYLCGVLYINFKLLWEPVTKIISTHAHGLDQTSFWSVFGEELKKAAQHVKNPPEEIIFDEIYTDFATLSNLYEQHQKVEDKPDWVNYRVLLWKSMACFSDVAEAKTRDVSELMLDFIQTEYTKSTSDLATYTSIKEFSKNENINQENLEEENPESNNEAIEQEKINKKIKVPDGKSVIKTEYTISNSDLATYTSIKEFSKEENIDQENVEEENPENGEHNEAIEQEKANKKFKKPGGKSVIKALIHKLGVFSQIRSPKSMYREPELYNLYFELLKHKNASIQKAALDCLMTYKFKYLTPYKENLYNLIDEKNFKHEIVNFRVDIESTKIVQDHRENLLPVILQIVFSKMSGKTGLRTGGKASSQHRRSLVLKFLAGCQENEMLTFIQKSFSLYAKFLHVDELIMVENISNNLDLSNCIAPKKLLSTINLLNVILDQFGGHMGDILLTYLLKILLTIGATIKGSFDQMSNVHSGYFSILRNLRTSCIKTLETFFEHFENYNWSKSQIEAIFYTFVSPYLEKLNIEGIHSPTSLLKLFKQWGTNPKYFKLLVKYKNDQYPLENILKLLVNEKSNISVINVIYDIIESLLKYKVEDSEQNTLVDLENVMPIKQNILDRLKTDEKLNYGSCILLPHVPTVLERIKKRLQGKNKSLNSKELFILSRISELVWESEISDQILHLLLPVVAKKVTLDEQVVQQFLTTVYNLIKNIEQPDNHLKQITPLFADVVYPSCRKILLKTLDDISKRSENHILKKYAFMIEEINAYDVKWVDQPDFERRHQAFKKIQEAVKSDSIDLNVGTLLIHNFYYLIKNEKDLALRENSSYTLKELCVYLVKKYQKSPKEVDYLLNQCTFNLIKNGLRTNNNMDLRHECIGLLGHLSRECLDGHFIFRDLNKFTNKTDLEVDFFENLTHLQVHRHARAMLKVCQILKEETIALNTRTLTQFLLPFATFYLCSEKFVSKNSLIDAAIEMVGVICKILPWHQYEGLLKYSLQKLRYKSEFQKQLVRLTVVILDGFHFDLSKGYLEVKELKAFVEDTKKDFKNKSEVKVEAIVENIEKQDEETQDKEEDDIDKEVDEIFVENLDGQEDEEEVEEEKPENAVKICEKISVLCKSTATRVIRTIQNILLPQLHKSLAQLTNYDASHKVNRRKTSIEREEEDLLRVPISLAVVKLLQRLPKEILDLNLPGVFMKICTFLKSQLESVRRVARETLQKIMLTLGPKYLKMLLNEMSTLLNRGFHSHVLVFTVHGVLNCLKGFYEEGDLDQVLLTVLNLCTADLFGILSEEKEVVKIGVKTSEAKSTKSYDTLQILAQYITDRCLLDIVQPIKNLVETSHNFKAVQKAQDALRHIALGLVDNTFVPVESLLKFAYGTASESIPQLLPVQKKQLTNKEKEKAQREKEDCFIIPKIPGNRTAYREAYVKTSNKTNAHVIVEFGLRLCHVMLKRDRVKGEQYKPFIDPFVVVFKNCLKSKHVKLCTLTLQCLSWVMKCDLPSMRFHIKSITKELFSILHKYAAAGLSKGDNFDMVVAAFKATSVLVRDVHYHTIDTNQLKILLLYAEQDMHDHDRQATAFNLLKAIISRKLVVPEIHDIMGKVAELSVTSELNHVRFQARQVFHQFLMEYPLGNTLEKHISFYTSQMSYDMQYGRESAIEMIQSLINSFPLNTLKKHSGTFFITLGVRLVNDDVPECRKMVADCLSSLLGKLSKTDRDPLFEILLMWFKDKNVSHRRLAAQLCGILVTVEKDSFETRIRPLHPLLLKQFGIKNGPGQFVKVKKEKPTTLEEDVRIRDHHYFQVLQLILKLCQYCPSFLKKKDNIESLAYQAQILLGYSHDWVRLAACQFLGYVLSSVNVEELTTLLLSGQSEDSGYLFDDPESRLKSLTLDLCDQLQPGDVKSDMAEQVIKNLVVVAKVLQKIPIKLEKNTNKNTNKDTETDDKTEENIKNNNTKINLLWLAKLMRKIVNKEIIENASSSVLRTEIFKWIAGVSIALDLDNLRPVLPNLLAPLVREMVTTEEKDAPLRQLAKGVAEHIKKRIGLEEYTNILQRLQQNLSVRRAERKRNRTQLAVTDPEMFAKKKIKRHEKKKVAKKRKMEIMKGKKFSKKRKTVDLEENAG